jgi:hypothetical protein
MSASSISEETKECLLNKRIVDIGIDYIVLSNGFRIYLEEAEIDALNDLSSH